MGCTESAEDRQLPGLPNVNLTQILGQGTFGTVYAAVNTQRKAECAVKVINLGFTPIEHVEHEAQMLRKLEHPRVAKIWDMYRNSDDSAFLVMDLYRGGSLLNGIKEHWRIKGPISFPIVQNFTKMMTQATEWLHYNNVVHRDLKPDNFLLNRIDLDHTECQVFLGDFGTACTLGAEERLVEQVGTQAYWAPEVYGKNYGFAADSWALGVIVFGMIWTKFPFSGEQETRTLRLSFPTDMLFISTDCGFHSDCAAAPQDAEDLARNLLDRDEVARLTAKQALEHRFLSAPSAAKAASIGKGRTFSGDSTGSHFSGSTAAPPPTSSCAQAEMATSSSSTLSHGWEEHSSGSTGDAAEEYLHEANSFLSTCSAAELP